MTGPSSNSSSSSSSSSSRPCSSFTASSSPKSLGAFEVAGVTMSCGSMANGGERPPEEAVLPESGLSLENVRKSKGEVVMG